MTTLTRGPLLLALSTALLAAACGDGSSSANSASSGDRLQVAAAFQPIDEIVRRVGGERVAVIPLTDPGAEAHDAQLTAKLLERVAEADAVMYLGQGFQATVQEGITSLDGSVRRVDLLVGLTLREPDEHHGEEAEADADGDHAGRDEEGHEEDGHEEGLASGADPHVWLSPLNMIAMARAAADALEQVDAAHAAEYSANADSYIAELTALDAEMTQGLAACSSNTFVTNHQAFGYLADRYGLTQLSIAGLSPDDQPSAQELETVAAEAKEAGVSVIFVEDELNAGLAETLANELGLSTAQLQTFETLSAEQIADGVTYAQVQRDNLAALTTALGCSA